MRRLALAGTWVLLWAGLAAAQAPPVYVSVWIPRVRAEKTRDFERVSKRFIDVYNKAKSPLHWVSAQRIYGDTTTYVIYTELQKWAELDSWPQDIEVLSKVLGPAEAERFMKQADETVQDTQAYFLRLRDDLSLRGDRNSPAMAKVMRTSAYWVRPGRGLDFEALVKRVIEAHTKLNTSSHFTFGQTLSGGGPNYWSATFAPNFAEFDTDPGNVLQKAFGPAEAESFFRKVAEVLDKSENYTHVLRPDLSRAPQDYVEANKAVWGAKPKPAAEKRAAAEKQPAEEKKPAAAKKP